MTLNNKYFMILGAGILFLLSFLLRWWSYTQTEFANGWDSYFYLDQLKSLIETGKLHSFKISALYPILYTIHLLSNDYVLTYKICACLFVSTFVLISTILVWRNTNNFWLTMLVGSFFLFSGHLTFFGAQYLKNMLALNFLLLLFLSFSNKKWGVTILFLISCLLTHKVIGLIALVFLSYCFLIKYLKLILADYIKLPLLVIGTWGGILLLMLNTSFSAELNFSPIFLPFKLFNQYSLDLGPFWKIEFVFVSLLFIALVFYRRKKLDNVLLSILGVIFFLCFPFLKWDLQGISLRFSLLFLLLAPLIVLLLKKINKFILIAFSLLFFTVSFWSWKTYNPATQDPNYAFYKTLSERIEPQLKILKPELVIAHKSLAEYLSFTLNQDVLPWAIPDKKISDKTWRLGYGLSKQSLNFYQVEAISLPGQYFLIKEINWNVLMLNLKQTAPGTYKQLYNWRNPYKVR